MDSASLIRSCRRRAGLTLRELAGRADTSHSAIAAYESGAKTPNTDTLKRVLRAAGFDLEVSIVRRVDEERMSRGDELAEVLALAEQFPARHEAQLMAPVFGR